LPPRSKVAIESSGGWYWLVDEIEAAGLTPQLAHAYDAKQRMASRNKTDLFINTLPSRERNAPFKLEVPWIRIAWVIGMSMFAVHREN